METEIPEKTFVVDFHIATVSLPYVSVRNGNSHKLLHLPSSICGDLRPQAPFNGKIQISGVQSFASSAVCRKYS